MTAYSHTTDRDDIEGLVHEDVAADVIEAAVQASAALTLFPRMDMDAKVKRLPVLSAFPTAYWVDAEPTESSDTSNGQKSTTSMAWDKKYLEAEEIAVIVPVHENILSDNGTLGDGSKLTADIRKRVGEAIGHKLDAAVLAGTELPASWATNGFNGLGPDAVSASNNVAINTAASADGGSAADLLAAFAKVDADGFHPDVVIASYALRSALISAGLGTGAALLDILFGGTFGAKLFFSNDTDGKLALVGQANQCMLGVRKDITVDVLSEGLITDQHGAIVYNLAQQDMVALRFTARFAFQVANEKTPANDDDNTRYPFAVLTT